jgi:hypothetical protein
MTAKGYFRVSMDAARSLVESSEGPELLAGYIALCSHRFGKKRTMTCAGAKKIRTATGCTDWRSKRVMDDLRSLCFGDKGQIPLITKTGERRRNADVYEVHEWPGVYAYVPALLVDTALKRLCAGSERETCRDALLILLHLYANTDYAGWMGAPPDCFAYQKWETEGTRELENAVLDLGHVETIGKTQLWLIALPVDDAWYMPVRLTREIFNSDDEDCTERFWRALWFLLESGTVCKVAVVSTGIERYPLWVFNSTMREMLYERNGIHADLAAQIQRLATNADADPDNLLIREAVGENRDRQGTGMFYCLGDRNTRANTLLIPMFHAPTVINLDGLAEVLNITQGLSAKIKRLNAEARAKAKNAA